MWYCRNNQIQQLKTFVTNKKKPKLTKNAIIVMITTQVSLSRNLIKLTNGPTIFVFVILEAFKVDTHHQRAPKLLRLFDSHLSKVG